LAFGAAICCQQVPILIYLCLIRARNLKRDRFTMWELRSAIEADEWLTEDGEVYEDF